MSIAEHEESQPRVANFGGHIFRTEAVATPRPGHVLREPVAQFPGAVLESYRLNRPRTEPYSSTST